MFSAPVVDVFDHVEKFAKIGYRNGSEEGKKAAAIVFEKLLLEKKTDSDAGDDPAGKDKKDEGAGKAEGQILSSSVSDAMLPLDTVRSQAPLAPKVEPKGKSDAEARRDRDACRDDLLCICQPEHGERTKGPAYHLGCDTA